MAAGVVVVVVVLQQLLLQTSLMCEAKFCENALANRKTLLSGKANILVKTLIVDKGDTSALQFSACDKAPSSTRDGSLPHMARIGIYTAKGFRVLTLAASRVYLNGQGT